MAHTIGHEPVLVEHSDDRLAEVEKAKRTGEAFQSVGAKGYDIVDREVLRAEVERVSNANSSDEREPLPDYLVELKDSVEDEQALNIQKAADHSEYSAEVARRQIEEEDKIRTVLRQDPYAVANAIIENNRKIAEQYAKEAAAYAEARADFEDGVVQETRPVRLANLNDEDPVTALGQRSKVTDISEKSAQDELINKDRVIYGEDSFIQQAKAKDVSSRRNRRTERTKTEPSAPVTAKEAKAAAEDNEG